MSMAKNCFAPTPSEDSLIDALVGLCAVAQSPPIPEGFSARVLAMAPACHDNPDHDDGFSPVGPEHR